MSSICPSMASHFQDSTGRQFPSPAIWVRELLRGTPSLHRLIEPLTQAAEDDMTVLLTGETGTGKTHLARLVHIHSRRQNHPLQILSCGAHSPRQLASELFGHVRGAFPGADRDQLGKLGATGQGTLLLDEVDALGLEQQAQLLRVLETGEFEPLGSTQTRHCHARVMASSKLDLEQAVARGKFRPDLYYRLRVLALHLPPLRERPADIGPLARSLVAHFGKELGKGLLSLDAAALTTLKAFPWPGNLRQLRHVVQQGVLVSTGPQLLRQHLPLPIQEYAASSGDGVPTPA
jgi:two-component system response regulator HydG